jgi:prepilin-type N-terminal cleavage/methylation domain-containing protein
MPGRVKGAFVRRWRRLCLGRGDRGDTLIEVLVAVSILGVAMIAVTGGMATSIIVSDIHHKESVSGTALANFAEALQAAPYVAAVCPLAVPASYATATVSGTAIPGGYTATILNTTAKPFDYWNATTLQFQSTCPATDGGAQRLWLQVSSSDGRAVETVQLVKRKP